MITTYSLQINFRQRHYRYFVLTKIRNKPKRSETSENESKQAETTPKPDETTPKKLRNDQKRPKILILGKSEQKTKFYKFWPQMPKFWVGEKVLTF